MGKSHNISDYREGKSRWRVTEKKGEAFDLCGSLSEKYVCCGVHVLKAVSNCPFNCTYCFLQNYLTDAEGYVVKDVVSLVREIREKTQREPWRFFRVGTWELGDSLAEKSQEGPTRELIRQLAPMKNVVLELKTKSDRVDHLLRVQHQGRVIVSWSVNPSRIIEQEEKGTASLERRIEAMRKVIEAGYWVGIHFDPMIEYPSAVKDYDELATTVFKSVPAASVAWISMGSLRFNPEMRKTIETYYPESFITAPEMILGDDNKVRYPKPVRVERYRSLYQAIRQQVGADVLVYLCMERPNVWEKVMGFRPRSIGHLDYLITESLFRRFSGLVPEMASVERYESVNR